MKTPPKPDQHTKSISHNVLVKDMMTQRVISITPDRSLIEAAQILFDRNFDGLPVVNDKGILLGIITQYDLVSKGANIHIPTFVKLMKEMPLYSKDKSLIKPSLKKIVSMEVRDVMNAEPLVVNPDQPIGEVAQIFSEHHRVNPIPVVDESNRLHGIISRYDLIRLYTGSMATAVTISNEASVDKRMDLFMKHFERSFVVVSKFRTRFWLLASFLFIVVGFIIAMMLIIRFEIKN